MVTIQTEVVGDTAVIGKLDSMTVRVHEALLRKVSALAADLRMRIIGKISGEVLHVRSGRLRRSIKFRVEDQDTAIYGVVLQTADVPYGRIHEYGGVIHVPEIKPVTAKALRFFLGGKEVFAMHAKAHTVIMPERSYMRSALKEKQSAIIQGLKDAVREGTS